MTPKDGMKTVGVRTGGLHTGTLHTGNLEPLPQAKFPQVGRIPPTPFDVGFEPRVLPPLLAGSYVVTQPVNGKVLVRRGYVLCIDPKSTADPMMAYTVPPEIDSDDPTEFSVADGKSLVVKLVVNSKDIVTSSSALIVDTDTASTHPQPPPSAAGEGSPPPLAGFYYYRIADFVDEGGTLVTKQVHSGGAIVHRPLLPEMYNIAYSTGTRYEVFKKWNAVDVRFEFRPLVQMTGTDVVPIMMPLQAGEPPYDAIRWRGLKPRDTLPQIRVRSVGGATSGAITIEGNGVDGVVGINFGGSIEISDGLVASVTEGQRGQSFDLVNYPCVQEGSAPSPNWTIYFREGQAFYSDPGGVPDTTLVQYDGFSCLPPDGP